LIGVHPLGAPFLYPLLFSLIRPVLPQPPDAPNSAGDSNLTTTVNLDNPEPDRDRPRCPLWISQTIAVSRRLPWCRSHFSC